MANTPEPVYDRFSAIAKLAYRRDIYVFFMFFPVDNQREINQRGKNMKDQIMIPYVIPSNQFAIIKNIKLPIMGIITWKSKS